MLRYYQLYSDGRLTRFQEVFIPGFPFKIYTSAPDEDFVLNYQKNSMVVGSPEYLQIRRAVRDAGIW